MTPNMIPSVRKSTLQTTQETNAVADWERRNDRLMFFMFMVSATAFTFLANEGLEGIVNGKTASSLATALVASMFCASLLLWACALLALGGSLSRSSTQVVLVMAVGSEILATIMAITTGLMWANGAMAVSAVVVVACVGRLVHLSNRLNH